MPDLRFSVLIDGDNISPKILLSVLSEINRYGDIVIKRVYGDWTTNNMNGWKELLRDTPIRPIQQFRYGENATDGALIMDAIELVSSPNKAINAFCIVSSDSDYYSLALRLREYGMYVLGIGRRMTRNIFVNACNRFIYIDNLQDVEKGNLYATGSNPTDSEEFSIDTPVEFIINSAYLSSDLDNDQWMSLAELGKVIRNQYPSFDPRSYNHTNLLNILKSYPDLFEIRKDDLTPPNYWMRIINSEEGNNSRIKEGAIKRVLNNYGFIETDEGDYFFTFSNIKPEQRQIKIKKGMPVKFKVFKFPNKNGETTEEKNGKATEIEFC